MADRQAEEAPDVNAVAKRVTVEVAVRQDAEKEPQRRRPSRAQLKVDTWQASEETVAKAEAERIAAEETARQGEANADRSGGQAS